MELGKRLRYERGQQGNVRVPERLLSVAQPEAGTKYPATMVITADHDDRVVPAHSFKFAATLQECNDGTNPTIIRIESKPDMVQANL